MIPVEIEAGQPIPSAEPDPRITHALLTVSDTGCGIAPEVRERLFEPFFTTKSLGSRRSRGMGLAVVYAAVKNANGLIEVEGEPGAGTTFRVYLPLASARPETAGTRRDAVRDEFPGDG